MTSAMLITMVLGFALSVSVAVSIGLASIVGIQASNAHMLISAKEMFNAINKFPLAAIPFFILAGNLMETGGISRRLVEFAKSLVGGVQGGLEIRFLRAGAEVRRRLGLVGGHDLCHWRHPDPGAHQARLPHHLGGRAAGHQRRAGGDHPALDPHDPVRRVGRSLDR